MLCQILLFFSWALLDRQMKIIFSFYKMVSNIYIFFVCALFSYIIRSRIRTRSRTHKCLPLPVSHYFPLFFCFTSSSSPPFFSLVFLLSSPSASYNQVTPPLDAVTWKSSSSVKWLLSHACVSHGVSANP